MGLYINPRDGSEKEAFLKKYARKISLEEFMDFDHSSDEVPICLVNNLGVGFTAAGIGYNRGECMVFSEYDGRPKEFFALPLSKVEDGGVFLKTIVAMRG